MSGHCSLILQLGQRDVSRLRLVAVSAGQIYCNKSNLTAYRQLKAVFQKENFDLVHCHTPMGGVLGRLTSRKYRKNNTKVLYTAHGFHFYKGAPIKNWLLYYPVEWICAWWTDVLITINKEDYARAQKHMHAKRVEYIPGVGVDTKKFSSDILSAEEKTALRESLGVKQDDKMLLSVGELIPRKDHETAIRAVAKLNDKRIKYFICGTGELEQSLQRLIDTLGLSECVKLLGFRSDISALCDVSDLFVFPSLQEGLPVALMEAIASRLPVVCTDIRGNTDLVERESLFVCKDVSGLVKKIQEYINDPHLAEIEENYQRLKTYDLSNVLPRINSIYEKIGRGGVNYLYNIYKQQLLRKSIGVPLDSQLLLSVGELNANKNHEVVIRAIAEIKDFSIHYAIAGTGELHDCLIMLANSLGIGKQVHLLGFRDDVVELYRMADLYVHPSLREGLSVALMEAIASKTPVICSNIRGNVDLVGESALFKANNTLELSGKICGHLNRKNYDEIEKNYDVIKKYENCEVKKAINDIYSKLN